MSNTNGSEGDESLNSQIEFLKEAFGMSDSEAEERMREVEDLDLDVAAEDGNVANQDRLRQLLDGMIGRGEELDEQLGDEEAGFEAGLEAEPSLSDEEIERIEAEDLDIETVDGRTMVPADQLYGWIAEMETNLTELSNQLKMQEDSARQLSDQQTRSSNSTWSERDEELLKGLILDRYAAVEYMKLFRGMMDAEALDIDVFNQMTEYEGYRIDAADSFIEMRDEIIDYGYLREYEEDVRQNSVAKQIFDEADDFPYITPENR